MDLTSFKFITTFKEMMRRKEINPHWRRMWISVHHGTIRHYGSYISVHVNNMTGSDLPCMRSHCLYLHPTAASQTRRIQPSRNPRCRDSRSRCRPTSRGWVRSWSTRTPCGDVGPPPSTCWSCYRLRATVPCAWRRTEWCFPVVMRRQRFQELACIS